MIEYIGSYNVRKPWRRRLLPDPHGRTDTNWIVGYPRTPFGGWYCLTHEFGSTPFLLISIRKPWATQTLVSRWEGRPFK